MKNRKRIKNIFNKRSFVLVGILIICLVITPSLGRYVFVDIKDAFFQTKSFYFNSDKLTNDHKVYQIDNWSGVDTYSITINMNNQKNSYVKSDSDITYNISYTCSDNAICSISKNSGTIFSSGGDDYFNASITPSRALSNNETVWIDITAESTSPYTKSISARFILKVGIPGISYQIDDVSNRPYLNLVVTNTTDFYVVKQAFGSYSVNQRIDAFTYNSLSAADKNKCVRPLITLSFDPRVVILDMASSAYINRESYTTTNINGHQYINSISFRINLISSESVKFYKSDSTRDYTFPIVNPSSVINFSFAQ